MFRWGISGYEGLPKELPCIIMPLHMPPFLNPRQFDRFYWPTFEKLVNGLTCRGYTVTLFFEGDWSKYYDHLTALKPHLIGIFEYGELKVIKEKLGKTMCIMGNYPIGALKSDSTEKCIDIAKKILDAAAPGGGYIFTTGKALLRGREIDFEKLKAVHNFVIENGRY
jgi:uroporphyrinogen-III decarboxylase